MAHVEAKCDDERVVLLVRLAIAVVLGGVLSCGGQVASTATDAATAKYDATSYLDANVRFDAMSFETGVADDSSIATADAGNDVAAADVDAADCHRDASAVGVSVALMRSLLADEIESIAGEGGDDLSGCERADAAVVDALL